MQKYIQYPTETIKESNQLSAPVIPFDVEFTIDGVNGLRYGDILDFPGLPEKYKIQTIKFQFLLLFLRNENIKFYL